MSTDWFWVDVGCAECRGIDTDSIVTVQAFATRDDAEAAATKRWYDGPPGVEPSLAWRAHPNGGAYHAHGSGEAWIIQRGGLDPTFTAGPDQEEQ